ncbi:MAG: hypothetical protein QGG73_11595, partial [Candidatus Hydrogenedentes bacterium]|nr:hypothetical protein [Candidatus Hydrogenedentota bacterium]
MNRKAHSFFTLDRAFLLLCAGLLALTVVYPTSRLVASAFVDWQWEAVRSGAGLEAIRNTL